MIKHFTVTSGPWQFPIDMLRYDACWPRSQEDATKISLNIRTGENVQSVELAYDTRISKPTPKRWESFGWKVQ